MVDTQDIWHKKSRGGFVSENPLSSAQPRAANPLSSARPHASATSTQTKPQPLVPSRTPAVSLRRGDTLWEVAQKKLGDGTRWRELHKVDGSRFTGQEARHLQVGTQVHLTGVKLTPSPASTVSVRQGDTLSEIAQKKLGNGNRWRELGKADGSKFTGQEARRLPVGTQVYLPGAKPATSGNPTVSVRQGDTLSQIAQKKLGDGSRWRELRKSDGSNFTPQHAKQLKVGTQVYLPGAKSRTETRPVGSESIARREMSVGSTRLTRSTQLNTSPALFSRNSPTSSQLLSSKGTKRGEYFLADSNQKLTGGARSAKFPGSNISPVAFHKTSEGRSSSQFQEGVKYRNLVDSSPLAQRNTQPGGVSDDQHLLGLSEDEYLVQHIAGDAASGYLIGDLGKKLVGNSSNTTQSKAASGKPKNFVSADAEELGRRITEHRQKTGGEAHPFERLGKYDVATGEFTLNPHLGVDEVTVHKTRPIARRPEGRAGDTWPSLYRQKRPGDTSTKDAKSVRKNFRDDMGKLMGDAITEHRRTTRKPSPLEKLGTYDPKTGNFKLDSKYAAGHTTSAHNNGRDMFAVEEGAPNSRDGQTREDPRRGGEVLRKRAVDIHGFPIEKELARKLFPELAENAPSHPGWTRGVKVTNKSLDVVRDHLLKTELQNTNTQNPRGEASARELSRKVAAGKVTDADLTDPKLKELFESLRKELKELEKEEEEKAARSGKKPKPPQLSLEKRLNKPGMLEFYASYTKALRDSAHDRKNAKRQSDTKPEGTRSGTSNLDTDSNGSRSSQARGDKPPLIAHRDKPDEANPEKKRSVNPADRSPRQTETNRVVRSSNQSPEIQRRKSSVVSTTATSRNNEESSPRTRSPQIEPEVRKPPVTPSGAKTIVKSGGKVLGKVVKPLGFAVDAYEVGNAMYKDGGIGENTKKVAKDAAVSWGSAAAGAGVGFAVAGPPGALVGGIVGGLAPDAVKHGPELAKKAGSFVKGLFD